MDCNFSLLPVHFAVDPAVDDVSVPSYSRQMSVSQQVDLMAKYMDIDRVPVARNTSSPDELNVGDTRPRTRSWGGREGDSKHTGTQTQADTQTETDKVRGMQTLRIPTEKKKLKTNVVQETVSKLGRVMSKRLKAGGKQKALGESELRLRRKASVGTATQSTRFSSLTDDMLLDHTQVNTFSYVVVYNALFCLFSTTYNSLLGSRETSVVTSSQNKPGRWHYRHKIV